MLTRRHQRELEAVELNAADFEVSADASPAKVKPLGSKAAKSRVKSKAISATQPLRAARQKEKRKMQESASQNSGENEAAALANQENPAGQGNVAFGSTIHANNSSSDDEGPEELSLAAGKEAAELRKQQERRKKGRAGEHQAQQKRRRKDSSEGPPNLSPAKAAAGQEVEDMEGQKGLLEEIENPDVLPASVIAYLQEQKRVRLLAEGKQQAPHIDVKEGKRQRQRTRQAGPVTVEVLDAEHSFAPSESALAFSQQRMFGGDIQRSRDMLRPLKIGKKRLYLPAADFNNSNA